MTQTTTGRARNIRVSLPVCRSGLGLGTGVLTADGEIPVEFLEPGDRVVTYDKGLMTLERIDVRMVPASEVVRVRPSVIDRNGAGRDFLVSARQRLLVRDWRAKVIYDKPSALVEAARLVDGASIVRLEGKTPVRLFQLVFASGQHLVHLSEMRFQAASAKMPVKAKA